MATYIVDYTQDAEGRWSARTRELFGHTRAGARVFSMAHPPTPSRLEMVDCVHDVYDAVGDSATLEVGAVNEWPGLGL